MWNSLLDSVAPPVYLQFVAGGGHNINIRPFFLRFNQNVKPLWQSFSTPFVGNIKF